VWFSCNNSALDKSLFKIQISGLALKLRYYKTNVV
jgi:hypothetical protein